MKLTITDIKPYPVWVGHRNQMLVKVETNQGIYGWGESGLSWRELAVAGAIQMGAMVSDSVAVNAGVAKGFNKDGKLGGRVGFTFGW